MVGRCRSEEFLAFCNRVAEGIEPAIPVHSVLGFDECVGAIEGCIAHHNANGTRPFALEPEAQGSRRGVEEWAPEAAVNGIK